MKVAWRRGDAETNAAVSERLRRARAENNSCDVSVHSAAGPDALAATATRGATSDCSHDQTSIPELHFDAAETERLGHIVS